MAKRASTGKSDRAAPSLSVVPPVSRPGLDADVTADLGDRLRAMYDSILHEPLPDRFLELLGQLDDSAAAGAKQSAPSAKRRRGDK